MPARRHTTNNTHTRVFGATQLSVLTLTARMSGLILNWCREADERRIEKCFFAFVFAPLTKRSFFETLDDYFAPFLGFTFVASVF